MQDKTINNALLALRKQIIRESGEGLDHVEALLALRGVDLTTVYQAKAANWARRGHMHRMALEALKDGPLTRRQLVDRIAGQRPEVPPERIYWRTDAALAKLQAKGLVRREGRVWST